MTEDDLFFHLHHKFPRGYLQEVIDHNPRLSWVRFPPDSSSWEWRIQSLPSRSSGSTDVVDRPGSRRHARPRRREAREAAQPYLDQAAQPYQATQPYLDQNELPTQPYLANIPPDLVFPCELPSAPVNRARAAPSSSSSSLR